MIKTMNLATIGELGGPFDLRIYECAQPKDQTTPVSTYPPPTVIANMSVPHIEGLDYANVHRITGNIEYLPGGLFSRSRPIR